MRLERTNEIVTKNYSYLVTRNYRNIERQITFKFQIE